MKTLATMIGIGLFAALFPLTATAHPIHEYCAEYGYDASDSDLEACAALFGWDRLNDHHAEIEPSGQEDEPGWECETSGNGRCEGDPEPIMEDDPAWNCHTMGNRVCGSPHTDPDGGVYSRPAPTEIDWGYDPDEWRFPRYLIDRWLLSGFADNDMYDGCECLYFNIGALGGIVVRL